MHQCDHTHHFSLLFPHFPVNNKNALSKHVLQILPCAFAFYYGSDVYRVTHLRIDAVSKRVRVSNFRSAELTIANATYVSFTVVVEVVFKDVLQVFRCENQDESAEAFSARDLGERVLQRFVVVFFLRMPTRTLADGHSKKMRCCYD